MPFTRRRKTTAKKRFAGKPSRFRKNQSRTVRVQRSVAPISDVQILKLKYAITNVQLSTGGTPNSKLMRGNSVNDPEFSAGGHQPLGHDQWCAFYDKYLVMGSSIKVLIANTSNTDHIKVALLPKDESTVVSSWDTLAERPYAKIRYGTPNNGSHSTPRLSGYMSTKKILGLKDLSTQDDEYAAACNTDPSRPWYWHIYFQALNNTTAIILNVNVEMTYYVKFFDRKPLAQS